MKKLLITGFQPFDGESVNPALEVAKGLQGKTINGYEVIAREIPVVRFEALKAVQAAIEELQPNAVITIGQAGGRPDITVERVGINIDDFRIPDNKGNQPIDEPVVTGGPVAYWATLPIKKMVANVKAQGIPASVSNSAGTYVCNHLLYGLLHYLTTQGKTAIPAGFIHIPYLPEQMAVRSGKDAQVATMSLDTLLKGFETMIAALD
ncbi:Pyrrolidone-carboxylate peptidase [Cardiobacterium hominis]|uniref:Pyrrolidone-carboxylate peptidase n=1 Tax=Cardiobacterium hominis (strain ATCC 15826 / DSM 8339 / NCTC 10426 / 6573) TaxID=638300 RepID=C8NAJ0_CARH6|nr:pyroglutamyl-peptidase I [Cardiobacterium hominis]EEV88373.1 pyroglutamyl-peptidase I [Cardiobacterium hominis ATCC 15826]VEG78363.1 Pyrrolidone-carboxylate peptidase [Cardiobacterium hominis]